MLLVVACGSLAVAALLYVFWVTPEPVAAKSRQEREREFLQERKEVVYENLRDLQMEYRMGKLSDQDYSQLKAHYQEQLALLLYQAEQLGEPAPAALPLPGRCPRCGKDNPAENRFCGACGQALSQVEAVR